MGLTVAIFSFNRGAYLRNCVASVRRNMPFAEIRIYDDNSTDAETLAVLRDLGVPVVQPSGGGDGRHGGLYANMTQALDEATTELLMFLQEDMQVVRPVKSSELDQIKLVLDSADRRAFVFPGFMKASSLARYRQKMVPDQGVRAYVGRPDDPNRICYVDAMIADVAKLRAVGWCFAASERANATQAAAQFADMPYLGDPFVFYCPEVPIFRNRSQSLSSRIAAKLTGQDVKAFHDMTEDDVLRLFHRPLAEWPVAEEWLRPINPNVKRPFVFKDVKVRWWLNLLNKAESWWRR